MKNGCPCAGDWLKKTGRKANDEWVKRNSVNLIRREDEKKDRIFAMWRED